MPAGRPSEYSPEVSDLICEQIAEGLSLRTICAADNMPSIQTIFNWQRQFPEFLERYTRAKDDAADAMIEDMLSIADDSSRDIIERTDEKGNIYELTDHDHINRSRLRVDTRKWIAAKLKPKRYGDATLLKHADPDGNALQVTVTRIEPKNKS